MKILFDHQIFNLQKRGGISRYFAEIIGGLRKNGVSAELALRFSDNMLTDELGFDTKQNPFRNFSNLKGYKNFMEWLNRSNSLKVIRQGNFDVFHPTYYHPYFLEKIPQKPFVITIHDMIHEKLSHKTSVMDTTAKHKKLLAEKASHIIAVSENTKNDVIGFYGLPENKITVIHHGFSLESISPNAVETLQNVPFLLFVGERTGYKQFDWLLQNAAKWLKENGITLVVVGGKALSGEEKEKIQALGLDEFVRHLNHVSDAQLSWLYQQASAFVYPSIYEGFGLPILEAFAQNCPVILPVASCFPEVAGDAAFYYEVNDEIGFVNCLNAALDEQQRAAMIQKSQKRLSHFSWKKSVQEHLKVYENALKS